MNDSELANKVAQIRMMTTEVPEGAICWICHEDGTKGHMGGQQGCQSLKRDCSCRGTAGYAHISCLVQYAANKVADGGDITKPWRFCPICKQSYQNDLSLTMADAFIQMAEQIDNVDPYRYAEALWTKLLAVDTDPEESKKTARKMISILEQIDEPHKCSYYALNPKVHSDSAKNLMSLAYEKLGWQASKESVRAKGDDERSAKAKIAIENYEKYRDLAESVGMRAHVNDADAKIARAKYMDPHDKSEVKQNIPLLRSLYESDPSEQNFSNLMLALRIEGHGIELGRLMTKQISRNKRLLGPNHPKTIEQEYSIKAMSVRRLNILNKGTDDDNWCYRFVRYEKDGMKCVIAPMSSSHDFDGGWKYEEGKDFTIDLDDLPDKFTIKCGTPVRLQGLQSQKAAHLNGQIGDVRKYNKETKRYEVHFEDKTLVPRSASVKMANLRILTDLPSST